MPTATYQAPAIGEWMPRIELKLKVSEAPDMRLVLINRADNVALVRQAIAGVADALSIDDNLLADIKTVVSEACNNVVLHAYEGEEGPLEVYICPDGQELEVVVRDEGTGIQPHRPEPESGVQGVGLSLIQALTDRVEFRGAAGEGTEVRMGFRSDRPLAIASAKGEDAQKQVSPPAGETVVSVAAGPLAAPVLSRVVAMLAARSNFSVERLSDAQLISDAIAAHAPSAIVGRHVHMGLDAHEGALDLRVGPLAPDGGERIVQESAIAGIHPVIERLADKVSVEQRNGFEELQVTLSDAR
ncbi:MAG: serine/threonine-protein kinase RsbW [Solirubrobacteraceae bacterium]|jgi:serine/threonine-protein kinase RsbW|nr:serine/threonine-protein kinase RsbW [Solirubrobacteraceae bacterium]